MFFMPYYQFSMIRLAFGIVRLTYYAISQTTQDMINLVIFTLQTKMITLKYNLKSLYDIYMTLKFYLFIKIIMSKNILASFKSSCIVICCFLNLNFSAPLICIHSDQLKTMYFQTIELLSAGIPKVSLIDSVDSDV